MRPHDDDQVAGARRRHPCTAWSAPTAPLVEQVSAELAAAGVPHPDVAAALVEVRGRSGLDRATFAARAGVDLATVEAAEAGSLARPQLPGALRRMVPMPDPAPRAG